MKTIDSAKNSTFRAKARKNSRGAAMVEGAVVIPILTMFFGLLQFVHAEYDTKLLTMWDAHDQAWSYAAHGCIGDTGVVKGAPNMADNQVSGAISGLPNDPIKSKASDTIGDTAASFFGAPGIVQRDATGKAKWSMYQRTIVSRSWVFCNEQNYNGSLGLLDEFYGIGTSYIQNLKNRHK
ncbi:MAG: hypothetical protein ABI461_18585 [Polyangiaceae bacterium]